MPFELKDFLFFFPVWYHLYYLFIEREIVTLLLPFSIPSTPLITLQLLRDAF